MRDHRKLRAFQMADKLVIMIYGLTGRFPQSEVFGLTSQLRRGAVSVSSNIVEGCARHSEKDFLHFLDIAYASSKEVEYQVSVAKRLCFIDAETAKPAELLSLKTARALNNLIRSIRKK